MSVEELIFAAGGKQKEAGMGLFQEAVDFEAFLDTLSESKRRIIEAGVELYKRSREGLSNTIKESTDAYRLLADKIADLNHEEFWLITLNQAAKVISRRRISAGGIDQTAVDVFGKENIYTMSPGMTDNDLEESVDLHAKMYFSTRWDGSWKNYVYLGSTNATRNGFTSNVEFLMMLRFKRRMISWYEFADYFRNDSEHRFMQMVDIVEGGGSKVEEYQQSLSLRHAIASITQGDVVEENDAYTIRLTVSGRDPETEVYPLLRPDLKAVLAPGLSFPGLALIELSEFYVVMTAGLSRVVKIPTNKIPGERNEEICRRYFITSPDQFMDCISFLLSESKTAYVLSRMSFFMRSQEGVAKLATSSYPAVYEDLLREAYDSPDTFGDIKTFLESLPLDVVPQEFDELYKMIIRAIDGFRG